MSTYFILHCMFIICTINSYAGVQGDIRNITQENIFMSPFRALLWRVISPNSCAKDGPYHWRAQRGSFERQILKYKSDDLYMREGKAFLASHFGIYRLISPDEQCGYKDFVVSMITNLNLHLCTFCWFLILSNPQ